MRKKHVALICFDNPFLKPMEGGKKSILSRIRALEMLDIDLDIFLLNKRKEGLADLKQEELRTGVRVRQYRMRRTSMRMMLGKYPLSMSKRMPAKMVEDLSELEYDVALYEGEHVAGYRLKNLVKAKRHILYYHDIESRYRAQLSSSSNSRASSLLQAVEGKRFGRVENVLADRFDRHLFISCDEQAILSSRLGIADRAVYAPFAVEHIYAAQKSHSSNGRMLYVGDLTVESNKRSLEWFVRDVMPRVQPSSGREVTLRVVGRVDGLIKRKLEDLDSRVRVEGYVDSIDREYDQASFVIAPVLFGAGVKIKLLDALAHAQIVVATSKACEGTQVRENDAAIVVDDALKMAEICCSIIEDRDHYTNIAANGLQYVKRFHSLTAHAELLGNEIGR